MQAIGSHDQNGLLQQGIHPLLGTCREHDATNCNGEQVVFIFHVELGLANVDNFALT